MNVKSLVAAFLVATSLVGVNAASAAYRANYEASLVSDEGSRVIRTAEFVSSGVPLAQALEDQRLVLVPTIAPDDTFTIEISMASGDEGNQASPQGERQSFSGKVGTPLEIETKLDGVDVSLVFMLYQAST
jgi:hypothetical protein